MTDHNSFTADASKVTPTQFLAAALDRLFPELPPTRISERYDATRRYINAVWGNKDAAGLYAAYQRELDAIDAKWRVARDLNSEIVL